MAYTEQEIKVIAKGKIHLGMKHIKKTIKSMQTTALKLLRLGLVSDTTGYDKMVEGLCVAVKYLASDKGLADAILITKQEIANEEKEGIETEIKEGKRIIPIRKKETKSRKKSKGSG